MTVRVRDNGYRKVVAGVASLRSPVAVKVGILEDRPHGDDGATIADIALVHEYGLGDVPERSFLRAWVDENKAEIQRRLKAETEAVIYGQRTADVAMNRFGLWAVGEIKKRIQAGIAPPLAESTLRKRDPKGTKQADRAHQRLLDAVKEGSSGSRAALRFVRADEIMAKADAAAKKRSRSLGAALAKIGRYEKAKARAAKLRAKGNAILSRADGRIEAAHADIAKAQQRLSGHKPLIDTGALLSAITHAIVRGAA